MLLRLKLVAALMLMNIGFDALASTAVLVRGTWVSKENTASFQQKGTNHQRYSSNGFHLGQALLATEQQLSNNWFVAGVLNAYSDGERRSGLSQLYAKYRPLVASTVKPEIKIGAFYPSLSAENTDIGWLSPHFLTNSAINSWIGEELRTGGLEVSLRQNGRQAQRNWSWKLLASLFKGNDTTGTLLSWRGFALHDRQSLYNDRVNFAPVPGIVNEDGFDAPAWTDPFREIDNRIGFYLGSHLAFKRMLEIKYYYYNNNADPTILDPDNIYAWRTRFHSVTLRYLPHSALQVFSQFLIGNTVMGVDQVNNDFTSFFTAAAYTYQRYTFSTRIDWYQVRDRDNTEYDPNNSKGLAITVNSHYELNDNLSISAEWQVNSGERASLVFFQDDLDYTEHVLQAALTLRF